MLALKLPVKPDIRRVTRKTPIPYIQYKDLGRVTLHVPQTAEYNIPSAVFTLPSVLHCDTQLLTKTNICKRMLINVSSATLVQLGSGPPVGTPWTLPRTGISNEQTVP